MPIFSIFRHVLTCELLICAHQMHVTVRFSGLFVELRLTEDTALRPIFLMPELQVDGFAFS